MIFFFKKVINSVVKTSPPKGDNPLPPAGTRCRSGPHTTRTRNLRCTGCPSHRLPLPPSEKVKKKIIRIWRAFKNHHTVCEVIACYKFLKSPVYYNCSYY